MKVTNVNVIINKKENVILKGYANITLDDCIAIHKIRIIQGDKRLFIAMPSDNNHNDYVHPTNQETRKLFEDAILSEYNKMI